MGNYLPLMGNYLPLMVDYLSLMVENLPLIGNYLPLTGNYLPLMVDYLPLMVENLPLIRNYLPPTGHLICGLPLPPSVSPNQRPSVSANKQNSGTCKMFEILGESVSFKSRSCKMYLQPNLNHHVLAEMSAVFAFLCKNRMQNAEMQKCMLG